MEAAEPHVKFAYSLTLSMFVRRRTVQNQAVMTQLRKERCTRNPMDMLKKMLLRICR